MAKAQVTIAWKIGVLFKDEKFVIKLLSASGSMLTHGPWYAFALNAPPCSKRANRSCFPQIVGAFQKGVETLHFVALD